MTEEEKIKEEIAFTDYWFTELGKTTTPTFADAIEWAEKRQRKIDLKEILDAVDACFDFEWDNLNYANWRDQIIDAMKSIEGINAMMED